MDELACALLLLSRKVEAGYLPRDKFPQLVDLATAACLVVEQRDFTIAIIALKRELLTQGSLSPPEFLGFLIGGQIIGIECDALRLKDA
jgi:hypothetical protein